MVGAKDLTVDNIELRFPDGYPTGHESITEQTFTPTLISITPSIGSIGGTKITVTGAGFGVESAGLNLYAQNAGQHVCDPDSVEVTGYGVFTCTTVADLAIESTDTIELSVGGG